MPETGWARPRTARAWHWFQRNPRSGWYEADCATKGPAWEMPPDAVLVPFAEAGGNCCESCFRAYSEATNRAAEVTGG